jgi:transcription factor IIIB subunit 2
MTTCPQCGSTSISVEDSSTVCTGCGFILAENNITSDVMFAEGGDGSSNVVGQFVSEMGGGRGRNAAGGRQHRDVTIANGRRRIMHLASALKLNSSHVDEALRFFLLAVQHNFTQGRRTHNVIGACLYLVCRRHKTPHMLIDFSDALQANLFILGNTFFKLCIVMKFVPPLVDPSLYIHRFAASLQLGEREIEVANTALRIVQRMKRDWIQIGRRPAGVCGAALFIATRIHRVPIDRGLILRTVKVCDITLRRRITEFKNLPSAQVTFDEFLDANPTYNGDPEDDLTDVTSCDPPIYQAHRRKEALDEMKKQLAASGLGELELGAARPKPVVEAKEEVDSDDGLAADGSKARRSDRKKRARPTLEQQVEAEEAEPRSKRPKRAAASAAAAKRGKKAALEESLLDEDEESVIANIARMVAPTAAASSSVAANRLDKATQEAAMKEMNDGLNDLLNARHPEDPEADREASFGDAVDEEMADALAEAGQMAKAAEADTMPLSLTTAIAPSGVAAPSSITNPPANVPGIDLDASDIDDEEIEEYLNTPDQAAIKELLWTELHKEYLEEQAEKERVAAQLRAEGKEPPKKKARPRKSAGLEVGGAPMDEILISPTKEHKSRKLNYEALDRAKQMRLASSRTTKGWLENFEDEGGEGNEEEDMDTTMDAKGPLPRPPPSAYLGSLKPVVPSQSTTQQTTQAYGTQVVGDEDDDEDDEDEDDFEAEDQQTSEFNRRFRADVDDDLYDEY